jgi:membrane dipeptidase
MPSLHDKTIIIDGLIVSNFGPEIFRAMRAGGITAANCTCSIWEDFPTSMRAIAQWKTWFREHANLILQVYGIADIHRAKTEGKTGVILGWQNAVGFDDHLLHRGRLRVGSAHSPDDLQHGDLGRRRMLRE